MMSKKIFTFLFFSLLVIGLMHYFSTTALAQKGFKIEKKDDVIIVSNPKEPIPKNGLKKRIVFKEELSIGVIEGDENYMFGSRIAFNVDKHGNFYVSDYDNKRIQKYDPQGNYLLTIGRAGQGPGEFEFLSVARFDKDDNVYVRDIRNRRISFFDKKGKLLREIKIGREFNNIFINSKNFILALKIENIREDENVKGLAKLGLFDAKLNPMVVLYEYQLEPFISISGADINEQIKTYANSISKTAFQPSLCYKMTDEDVIYFGYPNKYEINMCSPDGKLKKKIIRDYEPIPINKKDKDKVINRYKESPYFTKSFPKEVRNRIFKAVKFPKYKPVYQSFIKMENGWLAVLVDSIENEYALIDLFDKEGRYIAQFKTNIPVQNFFFKNGRGYAVAEEEGFQFVKRYAIELQEYKNKKWSKSNIKIY